MENFNVSVNQIKLEENSLYEIPAWFLKQHILPPLTRNASWIFSSVPLICLFILTSVPSCCNYYRLKIYLFIFDPTSIRGGSNSVSPPSTFLRISSHLFIQINVRFILSASTQKLNWDFDCTYEKCIDEFGEDWRIYNIKPSYLKAKYGPLFMWVVQ